jgi:hypothetical protein
MRFFFRDKPLAMFPKEQATKDARSDPPRTATPDAGTIVAALKALGERFLARRKPVLTTDGPRTLAEINAAAEKLWPKPKPLVPVWKRKSMAEGKQ